MPGRGLEPLCLAAPDPKSGASANFATPAREAAFDSQLRKKALEGTYYVGRRCVAMVELGCEGI